MAALYRQHVLNEQAPEPVIRFAGAARPGEGPAVGDCKPYDSTVANPETLWCQSF